MNDNALSRKPTTKELQTMAKLKSQPLVVEGQEAKSSEAVKQPESPMRIQLIRQLKISRTSVLLKKAGASEESSPKIQPKNLHFQSIEMLNSRALTRKNKDIYEPAKNLAIGEGTQPKTMSPVTAKPGSPKSPRFASKVTVDIGKNIRLSTVEMHRSMLEEVKSPRTLLNRNNDLNGLRKNPRSPTTSDLPGATGSYVPPTKEVPVKSFRDWFNSLLISHDSKAKARAVPAINNRKRTNSQTK